MKLLQELTERYSKQGYEGLYLMRAVFNAAFIIAMFEGKTESAEYFMMREKQIERKISNL